VFNSKRHGGADAVVQVVAVAGEEVGGGAGEADGGAGILK